MRKGSMHGLNWHGTGRGSDVTRKCEKLRSRIFSLSFVVGMVKTQNSVITDLKQKSPPLLTLTLTHTTIKAVLTFDCCGKNHPTTSNPFHKTSTKNKISKHSLKNSKKLQTLIVSVKKTASMKTPSAASPELNASGGSVTLSSIRRVTPIYQMRVSRRV